MENNKVKVANPHLTDIGEDHFHHFGFNTSGTDVKKEYSDVKVGVLKFCFVIFRKALAEFVLRTSEICHCLGIAPRN